MVRKLSESQSDVLHSLLVGNYTLVYDKVTQESYLAPRREGYDFCRVNVLVYRALIRRGYVEEISEAKCATIKHSISNAGVEAILRYVKGQLEA